MEVLSTNRRERVHASLVLPAYNPGSAVEQTFREVRQFLRERDSAWEAVFVCDGCTDGSPERLAQLARDCANVRVISYTNNQGKGHAVRQGLLAAEGQFRLFTDVDLAYGFEDVLRVAKALERGADVAIATRTHPESRLILPPHLQGYAYRRHLQSQVFSYVVRTLLALPRYDTQAGLKGMTAQAAMRILPTVECRGFGFDCELLADCVRARLGIVEVPVAVRFEDASSTTSVHSARRMLAEVWKIRKRQKTKPIAPPAEAADKDDVSKAA